MPYGTFEIEEVNHQKLAEPMTAYIRHSMDFANFWEVFKVRGIVENEVVGMFWTKKEYKSFTKLLAPFLPRMIIWVLTEEGYRPWNNDYKPEFGGTERWAAMRPLLQVKAPVMC
jgi:hypothetical protein